MCRDPRINSRETCRHFTVSFRRKVDTLVQTCDIKTWYIIWICPNSRGTLNFYHIVLFLEFCSAPIQPLTWIRMQEFSACPSKPLSWFARWSQPCLTVIRRLHSFKMQSESNAHSAEVAMCRKEFRIHWTRKERDRNQKVPASLARCSETSPGNCLELGLDPDFFWWILQTLTDKFIPSFALSLSHTVLYSFLQATDSSPERRKMQAGDSPAWRGSEHWLPH